jgi:hypothetical protein
MHAAARHLEQLAHQRDAVGVAVRFDPGVLHIDSLAKYAAAFFRETLNKRRA